MRTSLRRVFSCVFPCAAALLLSACSESPGSRDYDVERYDLDGEYDWSRGCLSASVRIKLSPGQDGLANIDLDSSVNVKSVQIEGEGEVDFEVQPDKHLWVSLEDVEVKKGSPVVVIVDYEAVPSDHLRPIGAREGDPIDIRAVFTDSEPDGARDWMPTHDDPADRAIFSAGLRMSPKETLISNGKQIADRAEGSSRFMRYETAYPLPTYLMAFAISEFEVHATKQGETPVEVWHRKGVVGDHDAMAAELARMIGEMEAMFVPYPFERYALVLLPGFMVGGMENAGISFQRETSSTAPALAGDLTLAAHELAHQWFGDLITVKTWDDIWIKEGMATMLAEELVRSHVDTSGLATLNGHGYFIAEGEAIWDPSKAPLDKYDSGPYGRSAWFFTQIRKTVGDEAFFATMRQLLDTHKMGNISTDDVVNAFAPAFDPNGADKLQRALAAKALPKILFSEAEQTMTLTDAEGAVIAPMEYEWVAIDVTRQRRPLLRGELNALQAKSPSDLFVFDPDDVHPNWEFFLGDADVPNFLLPHLQPTTSEQLEAFYSLSGVHQEKSLPIAGAGIWPIDALTLPDFLSRLHSEGAQALSLVNACDAALANPSPEWTSAIQSAFQKYPTPFGLASVGSYISCAEVLGEPQPWDAEWQKLAMGLPNGDISAERLTFLSRFDVNHREVWAEVLDNGGTLRSRQIAAGRIPSILDNHDYFVQRVKQIEASEILRNNLLNRLGSTTRQWKDEWINGNANGQKAFDSGLAALMTVLQKDETRPAHAYALCTIRNLLQDWKQINGSDVIVFDRVRWDGFVAKLANAPLSARALNISKNPSLCD